MPAFQASVGVGVRRLGGILQRGRVCRRSTARTLRGTVKMVTVDSHVHVWDPAFTPEATHPLPSIVGSADDLISKMDAAGVDKTLVVQPINYKFNHACVSDAMARYPNRLYGVALADTTLPAAEAAAYVRALLDGGYRGVRLNPSFASLRSDSVRAVLSVCGERGLPACVFARPEHYDDVEHLLQAGVCSIVVDHFGFASTEEDVERLVSFAKYESAYVKASAWFRVSKSGLPHADTQALLEKVVAAYGSRRVLAGTDYPYVTEQYGYGATFDTIRSTSLSSVDLEGVCGGAAAELYKLGK